MAARPDRVPTTAELQAYSLGKLDSERESEVESYLAEHPERCADLEATPDDEVLRPLRGAGALPKPRGRSPLLQLAVEAVIPVIGGCAGALAGGPEGGLVGVAVGQAVEKGINFFGERIVNKWLEWLKGKPRGMQEAALAQLAEVLPEVARGEVMATLHEKAPQASAADRQFAIDYLTSIPRSVRRSLLSDREKGGRSVPPNVSMDDAASLLQLLPADVPPYSAPCALPDTDYRLEELIGSGGFGAVYRATGSSLQHLPLAIKFCLDRSLLPGLEKERANLEKLMKAGGETWSPRLVRLYGYNLEHQTPFLVYEYVSGGDLVRWLATRRVRDGRGLTAHEVLDLIIQVAEALAFAHERGLVHRDLKPANVLMADGTIKLADFGIGGLVARQAVQASQLRPAEQASLFRGAGTPLYMSREQKQGDSADPRHDLYSLGVMWYQLLVGDVTRELHPGWAEELVEEHAVPPAHVETIKLCVGLFRRRPEHAGKVLEMLRAMDAHVATPGTETVPVKVALPERKGALTSEKVMALREALLRAVAAMDREPAQEPTLNLWPLKVIGIGAGVCPALLVGLITGGMPSSDVASLLTWGGNAMLVFIPLLLAIQVAMWLSHRLRLLQFRAQGKRTCVVLRHAIDSATGALSLPMVSFDRSNREALRRVGWSLFDEIQNRHLPRDVSAQIRLAGNASKDRNIKVSANGFWKHDGAQWQFLGSEDSNIKVFLDGKLLGEGSLKNVLDLPAQLCRGSHYLELRPAERQPWSSFFDIAHNGNCRVEISGSGIDSWSVVVFEQPAT